MRQMIDLINKYKFFLFLFLLCCIGYSYLFVNRALVEIVVDTKQESKFIVFWAKADQGFSLHRRGEVVVRPGKKQYRFYLTNLRHIDKLRIDTHEFAGEITLKRFTLKQPGIKTIQLRSEKDFSALIPTSQIESTKHTGKGLVVTSNGNDPTFQWSLERPTSKPELWYYLVGFLLIAIFLWLVATKLSHLNEDLAYVPFLLSAVLALVLIVACTTANQYHPDEKVHVAAAEYYKDHWKPPIVEDEAIRHTYSAYGASRLNTGEIYYFFAGKFAKTLEVLPLQGYLPYRLFNVFLLGLMLLYTASTPKARLLAIPFLLSPQIWYAFSYCTSDGFALFVAFWVGCQVIIDNSMLNRILRQQLNVNLALKYLIVGASFALLFFLKKNFYPYIVAVAGVLAVDFLKTTTVFEQKRFLKRFAILACVMACFFAIPKAMDISVNGFDKKERVGQLLLDRAIPMFNMASPLEVRSPMLTLKERGQSIKTLIVKHRWFENTFRSSFGVYGHSTIKAQTGFYNSVRVVALCFFFFFFGSIFIKATWLNKIESLALLSISIALVGVSLNHSWIMEVQPQGRYLFPIIGILGLAYGKNYKVIHPYIFTTFVAMLFTLSIYSFITEAIYRIPKIGIV